MVAIEERLLAAYRGAASAGLVGPELLPVRLAMACAQVLPVAGVGISMFGSAGMRIPVGASNAAAVVAERLQFTAGEGPCLDAQATGRSMMATETLIAQRWPEFSTGLVERTPFRAVAAIPWPQILKGAGTVDLLFHRSEDLAGLDIAAADAVVAQVEHVMDTESVFEFSLWGAGPAWLRSPSANSRNTVCIAMGILNVALEVSTSDALAILRGRAYATGRTVDDVAGDVVSREITADELRVGSDQ